MSGYEVREDSAPVIGMTRAAEPQVEAGGRLAWPAAVVVIGVASAALWLGVVQLALFVTR